jgi:hypothetical protein
MLAFHGLAAGQDWLTCQDPPASRLRHRNRYEPAGARLSYTATVSSAVRRQEKRAA